MTTIGKAILVKGELSTAEDVTIEGRIEGHIRSENGALVFAAGCEVSAEVIGRDVTIHGRVSGQVIATDVVDVRAGAAVAAQVMARRFILEEGARFDGRVEPQHLEAALRVAKFNQKKRGAL
jgi:cytoskeletal protein CcmA (bactofilin family)